MLFCVEISDRVNSEDIDLDSFGKDSQFLVQMLQQQLDNINEEIRYQPQPVGFFLRF